MKTITISSNDDYLIQGAKEYANERKITLSEYITSLIKIDLKKRNGYKIVTYYDNGSKDEESDFFTQNDLMESVKAIKQLFLSKESMRDGSKIIGYEVYEKNEIVKKAGVKN